MRGSCHRVSFWVPSVAAIDGHAIEWFFYFCVYVLVQVRFTYYCIGRMLIQLQTRPAVTHAEYATKYSIILKIHSTERNNSNNNNNYCYFVCNKIYATKNTDDAPRHRFSGFVFCWRLLIVHAECKCQMSRAQHQNNNQHIAHQRKCIRMYVWGWSPSVRNDQYVFD